MCKHFIFSLSATFLIYIVCPCQLIFCEREICGPEGDRSRLGRKAGQVHYPAERNTEIQWPGEAGGPIEQDHDSKMVDSWMKDLQ